MANTDKDKKTIEVKDAPIVNSSNKPKSPAYVSFVDEMRRHIKFKKSVRTKVKDKAKLWAIVILTMRHIYNAPNKVFSDVTTSLMIGKQKFTIAKYEENETVMLKTDGKDGLSYDVSFTLKRNAATGNYRVQYFDHALAPKTLFGFAASLSKFIYLRNSKFNFRKIKKDIKNQLAGKARVSLDISKAKVKTTKK